MQLPLLMLTAAGLAAAQSSVCTDPAASNFEAGAPPAFDACTYDCASLKAAMGDMDRRVLCRRDVHLGGRRRRHRRLGRAHDHGRGP
jgi:hypothetical protein